MWLALLLAAPLVAAAADFTKWAPAQPGEVRSPCPGLNSLANHGILPRSGKGLTLPILVKGLQDGLSVGADFALAIGGAGILSVPNAPLAISFDLNDISRHNFPIEHDGSLSRLAAFQGSNSAFSQPTFDSFFAHYDGMNVTSIPVASAARYARIEADRAALGFNFTYTPQQYVLSYGETALYLSTMGHPITGLAPTEWVRILFEEERLPYAEGWRPTSTPTNLATLGAMILQLVAANGDALPEGLGITTNTLKAAFGGYNPITGLLAHIL